MKKNTFIKSALVVVMFLLNIISYSQNLKPFTPRYDQDVRGDMLLIGNNILNRNTSTTEPEDSYNGGGYNSDFSMEYIDIDTDPATFSSSSANLVSPRPGGDNCYKIVYAGLYWGAILQSGSRTDINKVKFKLPTGGYNDITGQIIYDAELTPIGGDGNKPYACYADVTSLITPLVNPVGTYTVANVLSSEGGNGGTGLSAGWSLIIVYEDPTLTSKSIVTFEGFSGIGGATTLDIPISGFRTIPSGPVRAKFAMTALEGDQPIAGDYLRINGNTISTTERATNNFFNSSITTTAGYFTNRVPNSSNTLGYDAGILNVLNPDPTGTTGGIVIPNNATSATIRLGSTQDVYFYFFNAFAVDIIAPEIQLTKDVENVLGVPIGGTNVTLGQQLNYEIGFQNIGNDNATSLVITDVLPINVIFNPADLALPGALPPGVTFTFTAPRTLTFTIPNNLVEVGDPRFFINIRVQVVPTCMELDDACSNLIQNQAFATYTGTFNTTIFSDEGSIASFGACGFGTPGSTNFLVDLDDCDFTRTEVLCGGELQLTAAPGYDTYVWSGPGPIVPVTPNSQIVTISVPGTYTVNDNITLSPCKSIVETIIVVGFGSGVTNPAIPVADQIVVCPDNGIELPYIFLCGVGDSQVIPTNIADAISISWEQLAVASCPPVANAFCANENAACTWNQVGTGTSYTATAAGQYKIIINFQGGCQRIFYFNVYQNLLAPTVTPRDIICTSPGQITVNGVPPGYEYSYSGNPGNWQTSNIFTPINTAGVYTVSIRQIGVPGGCVFTVPNVVIQSRTMTTIATVTQPLCFGQKGTISLVANGVLPQYTFSVYQQPGNILVNSVGPIASNNHVFSNLNPGNYSYQITTQDGCTGTGNFTINNPAALSVTAALTRPLTCTDGEVTIYPVGGTPPYSFVVTGAATFTQASTVFAVSVPGTYNIQVIDYNNCVANTSITVANIPPPVFTVTSTNILCYGDTTGAINFNVTNANGYTLLYSITGGAPFTASPNFTNLPAGTYSALVQYSLAGSICLTTAQTITITQPGAALTASGGVAAVACATNGGNGIVRITNVQGGTPYPGPNFYQYNFGSGWQNLNQANLPPGTYTIYVRDANLCVFPMTVTIDPIPAPPTITVGPPTFTCSGVATSTVTVNNGSSNYAYQYFIDVPLTPPHDPNSNVFTNVPCGPHVVTVNYTLTTPATFSNLLREDFGVGDDTTSPGINSGYCFERQINSSTTWCNGGPQINDGDYSVTKRILFPYGAWYPFVDHTTNGTNPNARFLAINIGGVAGTGGILYSKPISDIIPNQDIRVSLWAANLLRIDPGNTQSPPDLTIQLVKDLGLPSQLIVASSNTGNIPKSNAWINYTLSLNPGANTSLSFVIRSNISVTSGNDVVIDDINVFQLPVACLTTRNFPINIACNQAFSAQVVGHHDVSCAGANDGTVTVAAQNFNTSFQISMDNGTTWTTHLTSPVTVAVPAGYPGFVLVRYDAAPANAACSFNLPQAIITPAPLSVSATFTSVTCTAGSTITATATGGTVAYQYQLTNSVGTVIVPYQSSPIFTNIPPGSYIVVVRDANLCSANTPITITAPVAPTATISAASDFCYDSTNGATIIVTPAGGVAPYTYTINGNPNPNNTFGPLVPGTYTIVVTDSFGCSVTLPVQTINPQLTLNTVLTKDLDCTASPNAVITGTIAGGYPGYTCMLNGVTPVTVTGSTFTYSAATAGTYQFVVTDTRGCTVQSGVITINPLVPVAATHVQVNNTCFGAASGSVTITPSGGVAPYTILFNSTPPATSTTTYTGLTAGTYPYQVIDSKSCTFNGSVTITQPAEIIYTAVINPITCNPVGGYSLGSICVNGLSGGVAPYIYTLVDLTGGTPNQVHPDPVGANYCFTNIDFGIYDLIVTDANGCTIVKSNLIMSNPPSDLTFVITPTIPSCAAGATVSVTLVGAIGVGPFEFGIMNSPINPFVILPNTFVSASNPPFTHVFTGLTPGAIYTIVVRDVTTGCYYFEQMTAATPTNSTMTVSSLVANPVACRGAADGSVTFSLSGYNAGATSISYVINYASSNIPVGTPGTSGVISPIAFPFTAGPLAPGTYNVQFTENGGANSGCGTTSATFTIIQSATDLTLSATTTNDNCNVNAGQIAPVVNGGTGPYTYQYIPGAGPFVPGAWISTNPYLCESGAYTVYVRDAYGCIRSVPVTVNLDPTPVVAATLANACAAQGSYAINVTLPTAGIAPYTYSIDGSGFVAMTAPFTISGLSSGPHSVAVRDANGCGNLVNINILPPVIVSAVFTTQPTCLNNDGTITVTATGGSTNYEYTLLNTVPVIIAGPQAGNVFAGQPAGNYIIRVRDLTTNCIIEIPFTLALPTPVTFTAVTQPAVCFGDSNGTITVNLGAGNNNPPYTYAIIAPPIGPQTSNIFSGLPAGTYTVQVVSGRGCSATMPVTINEAPVVTVPAATVVQFGCNAGTNTTNFATITVNGVTGGSGVYTNYEFILGGITLQTGTNNVYTVTNLAGGTYTINVYDANGCLGTTTAVINPFIGISDPVVAVTSPVTCIANEDITVSVTTTGGTPPALTYTINSIPAGFTQTNNTGVFTGLPIGDYSIVVTNPVTNCSVETIHYVFDPNSFGLTVTADNNVTCVGGNDGSVYLTIVDNDLTPTNDAGPFSYVITNITTGGAPIIGNSATAGPTLVPNLTAGVYSVTVTLTNIPNCPVTSNFTIDEPAAALTLTLSNTLITCITGNNDGSITATATGGWAGPYQYELVGPINIPYSSNNVFANLIAGNYTVNVRDTEGCIATSTISLVIPTPIAATFTATPTTLTCNGDTNATITVTNVTGGQGSNYSYILHSGNPTFSDSGPQASPVFTGLGAGSYTVTVIDGFNCSLTSLEIIISEPAIIESNLNVTTTQTCLTNTMLTLTAQGGTPPYFYSSNVGGPFIPFAGATTTPISVTPGTYSYYVQDANGCMDEPSNEITIDPLTPLTVILGQPVDILCPGSTGSISAIASGGLLNYVYTLTDTSGNPIVPAPTQLTPGNFTGLPAGSYIVHVTSLDCIVDSLPFDIEEPPTFVVTITQTNVKCFGGDDGAINITVVGGNPAIQYAISPNLDQFFTLNNPGTMFPISGLVAGTYTVIIRDSIHCDQIFTNLVINEPTQLAALASPATNETCFNDNDGSFTFTNISGGTSPYSVSYNLVGSPPGTPIVLAAGVTTYTFSNLPAGEYQFVVSDINDCRVAYDDIVASGVNYAPYPEVLYSCENDLPTNQVTIMVNATPASDGTGAIFNLDGGPDTLSNVFTNLTVGSHTVTVNINGCIKTVTFDINAVAPLTLTIAPGGLNEIVATAQGGVPPYTFTFNGYNNGSDNTYVYDHTGAYTVIVTDSNGCSANATRPFEFVPIFIPNVFTPNGNGGNDMWGPWNTANYKDLVTYIYDRYGRKVAELKEGQFWNGKYEGKELPTGDYWYVVKVDGNNDREYVGHFTLYR